MLLKRLMPRLGKVTVGLSSMKNSSIIKSFHVGVAVSAMLAIQSVRADQEVQTPITIPIHVGAGIDAGCEKNGNVLAISTDIEHGGCKAKVIFKRNRKSGPRRTVSRAYDIQMSEAGNLSTNIVIPKQPSDGGVGGNPYVYLVLHDGKGTNLTEEYLLGRCIEGLNVSADLVMDAMMMAKVHAAGCNNPQGSYLTLEGDMVLSGLHARFIFRNNEKGTHTAEVERDIELILDGTRIRVPKRILRNKIGPNPLISLQMLHDDGTVMSAPVVLGRCSKL